jgi:hypothetical protein
MLLLSEGETAEAWKPSNNAVLFWLLESAGYKSTLTLFCLGELQASRL